MELISETLSNRQCFRKEANMDSADREPLLPRARGRSNDERSVNCNPQDLHTTADGYGAMSSVDSQSWDQASKTGK